MDSSIPTKVRPETIGNTWEQAACQSNSKQVRASAEYCSAAFTQKVSFLKNGDIMLVLSCLKPTAPCNSVNIQFSTSNTGTRWHFLSMADKDSPAKKKLGLFKLTALENCWHPQQSGSRVQNWGGRAASICWICISLLWGPLSGYWLQLGATRISEHSYQGSCISTVLG